MKSLSVAALIIGPVACAEAPGDIQLCIGVSDALRNTADVNGGIETWRIAEAESSIGPEPELLRTNVRRCDAPTETITYSAGDEGSVFLGVRATDADKTDITVAWPATSSARLTVRHLIDTGSSAVSIADESGLIYALVSGSDLLGPNDLLPLAVSAVPAFVVSSPNQCGSEVSLVLRVESDSAVLEVPVGASVHIPAPNGATYRIVNVASRGTIAGDCSDVQTEFVPAWFIARLEG